MHAQTHRELFLLLEAERRGAGLSERKFAKALGISPALYWRMGRELRFAGKETMVKIAAVYPEIVSETLMELARPAHRPKGTKGKKAMRRGPIRKRIVRRERDGHVGRDTHPGKRGRIHRNSVASPQTDDAPGNYYTRGDTQVVDGIHESDRASTDAEEVIVQQAR